VCRFLRRDVDSFCLSVHPSFIRVVARAGRKSNSPRVDLFSPSNKLLPPVFLSKSFFWRLLFAATASVFINQLPEVLFFGVGNGYRPHPWVVQLLPMRTPTYKL